MLNRSPRELLSSRPKRGVFRDNTLRSNSREQRSQMRRLCILLYLLACIRPAPAATSVASPAGRPAHPWDNKRVYYLIERQGLVREKGFFVRRPGDYQKTPCVIVEEEKTTIVPPGEQTAPRAFRSKTITTPAGAALYREEEVLYGDVGRETITVSGGEAQIAASGYFGASGALPVPPGVLFEVSAEWLAGQSLHVGKTLTAGVLDREDRLVTIESITIVDKRENAESPSGPAVWTAEFLGDGKEPMRALFTSDGRLLRLESGDVVYQIATRAEYEQERRMSPASFAAPEAPPPPPMIPEAKALRAAAISVSPAAASRSFAFAKLWAIPEP